MLFWACAATPTAPTVHISFFRLICPRPKLITVPSGKGPFQVSHSVYSALSLNVKLTVQQGVFYPAKDIWEDVHFNIICVEKSLPVVKWNRFFHSKINFTKEEKVAPVEPPTNQVTLTRAFGLSEWSKEKQLVEELPDEAEDVDHFASLREFISENTSCLP